MRRFVILGVIVALGIAGFLGFRAWKDKDETHYRYGKITKGNVRATVSSTGKLQAITTVQVGTQVSGKIAEIYVDFNDRVKAGQLLAVIDPTLLHQAVRSAESDLERNRAELAQAERTLDRIKRLYDRQASTEDEYTTAQYAHAVAKAGLTSAEVNLERARQNLSYAEIRAPIDGIVLDRTADAGQTVAASLSAPQLFLLAGDLAAMEILASVDESDIGKIHAGQRVEFTVQAYPDETFSGTVDEVRLQSTTQENVVNYTVVVSVRNEDGRLLPGMTATVQFVVAEAAGVLKVPNAALRFRPTQDMQAALLKRRERRAAEAAARDSSGAPRDTTGHSRRAGRRSGNSGDRTLLWYTDENGEVGAMPVHTGLTDGQYTEVSGPRLTEGMEVIVSVATSSSSSESTVNPFQQQNQRGRPGPPPGM